MVQDYTGLAAFVFMAASLSASIAGMTVDGYIKKFRLSTAAIVSAICFMVLFGLFIIENPWITGIAIASLLLFWINLYLGYRKRGNIYAV